MAYNDFTTITKVRNAFDLTFDETQELFINVNSIEPSDYLKTTLKEYVPLANAINTEKARSELIIAPVLLEVRRILNFQIGFFSGVEFNVNLAKGLMGYCDYILTASKELYEIRTPVFTIVEAKNENIKGGLGQCMAETIAARLFNIQQEKELEAIYGAVTTGNIWKFIKLEDQRIFIDLKDYFLPEIDKILGILAIPFQVKN
ncbi:MAG: hypothetical protein F6K35_15770 [Okeania sp. SIO2H7]|nr:hypothetical protein [Okeania sp. SIO2H7]